MQYGHSIPAYIMQDRRHLIWSIGMQYGHSIPVSITQK